LQVEAAAATMLQVARPTATAAKTSANSSEDGDEGEAARPLADGDSRSRHAAGGKANGNGG